MTAVIREVLIKAKIVIEGDEALNKIRENARKWNGELEKTKRLEQGVTNEQKKLTLETNKTRRAQIGLDEALGKVRKELVRVGDIYAKGNKSALTGLDRLVRKEKELIQQIKRREDAIQKARIAAQLQAQSGVLIGAGVGIGARAGVGAGAMARPGAGIGAGVGAALGAAGARVNAARLRVAGVAAAPVAVVAITAKVADNFMNAAAKFRKREEETGVPFRQIDVIREGIARSILIGGAIDAIQRGFEVEAFEGISNRDQAIIALQKELSLNIQLSQAIEARYGKEFANQKLIIQNEKQRLKIIEQQVIDTEKQTRKAVAGEFGLLSPVEIRTVLDIAQRFKKGGRGAISSEEAEKLGEFRSLQDFVAAQTAKIKDPTFDALINIAGEGRRQELKQEKQIAQTAILQANKVVLDIDKGITFRDVVINATGFEDAIEKGMKQIRELVIKKFDEALNNAKAEVKKTQAQIKNNHNVFQ